MFRRLSVLAGSRVPLFGVSSSQLHTMSAFEDTFSLKLADLHEGLVEADIKEWLVQEGDTVSEFQDLCFVVTDKASTEISSPVNGVVTKIYAAEGDTAIVGSVLIDIEVDGPVASEGGDDAEAAAEPAAAAAPAGAEAGSEAASTASFDSQTITTSRGRVIVPATPAVRGLARTHEVDLSLVTGTGKDGRVLKGDVLAYLEGGASGAAGASDAAAVRPMPVVPVAAAEDRVERVIGVRKAMIRTMDEALTIPHFGYCDEVDVGELVEVRKSMVAAAEAYGQRLTMMPFFLKALSMAITEYPVLNASLSSDKTEVIYRAAHNVSIAMDTPDGLTVPTIKNVEQKSILDIAADLNRLVELGAKGRLSRDDLEGGTISLSNVGNIGGTVTSPVIIPGQVAIGALGQARKLPRFDEDGNVVAANIVTVSWSGDHRIIDGATMARFSNAWKGYVENPASMVLHLR